MHQDLTELWPSINTAAGFGHFIASELPECIQFIARVFIGFAQAIINNKTNNLMVKVTTLGADSTWGLIVEFIFKQHAYTSYQDYWLH